MRRAIAAVVACCALVCAGCGSSSRSAGSATSTGARSSTAGAAVLSVTTTPRYASPSASAPVHSGLVQIAYRNIAIAPDTLRVKVGSTIRWTNHDPVQHNVTSQGGPQRFASGNLADGATFEIKVSKPGVIHYLCTIHPASMNGTIEVLQ